MRQLAGDSLGSYFDMFYFSCLLLKLIASWPPDRQAAERGLTTATSQSHSHLFLSDVNYIMIELI